MTATASAAATRFFRPGKTTVLSLPTVTAMSPIRTEIDGGDDVTGDIASVSGFTKDGAKIDTPDWGSRTVSNVPGRVTFADSSITWYASEDGVDRRADFAIDQVCYIVFMDIGDVPTKKMDVYKCTVLSVSSTKDGDNAAQVVVSFSVQDANEQVVIPA